MIAPVELEAQPGQRRVTHLLLTSRFEPTRGRNRGAERKHHRSVRSSASPLVISTFPLLTLNQPRHDVAS